MENYTCAANGGKLNTAIVYVGKDEWRFPAPLVKSGTDWRFDSKAGLEEVQDRQIGGNELAVVAACQTYLDVQVEYFSWDRRA